MPPCVRAHNRVRVRKTCSVRKPAKTPTSTRICPHAGTGLQPLQPIQQLFPRRDMRARPVAPRTDRRGELSLLLQRSHELALMRDFDDVFGDCADLCQRAREVVVQGDQQRPGTGLAQALLLLLCLVCLSRRVFVQGVRVEREPLVRISVQAEGRFALTRASSPSLRLRHRQFLPVGTIPSSPWLVGTDGAIVLRCVRGCGRVWRALVRHARTASQLLQAIHRVDLRSRSLQRRI